MLFTPQSLENTAFEDFFLENINNFPINPPWR